jgi:hypothetical protein
MAALMREQLLNYLFSAGTFILMGLAALKLARMRQ